VRYIPWMDSAKTYEYLTLGMKKDGSTRSQVSGIRLTFIPGQCGAHCLPGRWSARSGLRVPSGLLRSALPVLPNKKIACLFRGTVWVILFCFNSI
jgi:hypothetical protein